MSYARRAWIVLWKDVLIEWRSKASMNALFFFVFLLLFLFQFALGPDPERLVAVLPGLLWLGVILAGLLGLGRTFLTERDNDCWEGLILAPGDKSAVYVGKLAGNFVLMGLVVVVLVALVGFFHNVDIWKSLVPLAVVILPAVLALAATGTLFGTMTARLRARELLFPLLLLPIQVPVLLATVKATEAVLGGQSLGTIAHWLKLLAAADVIYLVVGLLTFEFLLEA